MRVEKLGITIEQQTEQELAASQAVRAKAVEDYNIMMGNLEDPADMEDDEDE